MLRFIVTSHRCYQHTSRQSAEEEAARLKAKHPSKTFHIIPIVADKPDCTLHSETMTESGLST
jgi:hypothetical protein